jgi:ankyrin repeat protein
LRNDAGQTPLMSAAEKGYADMVQVLLQNGANPKLANNQGDSALTIALMKGYPAFLKGWPESDRRY